MRRAASLVELLVVLAIIGVLVGLLLPAVLQTRETASRTSCQNNLRQLGLAENSFHSTYHQMAPYATGRSGEPYANWLLYLLPHLDETAAFNQMMKVNGAMPLDGGRNRAVSNASVAGVSFKFLRCGSDPTSGKISYFPKTSYQTNWYAYGDENNPSQFPLPYSFGALTDGTANVVLFAEAYSECDGLVREAFDTPSIHTFGITREDKPSDDPSYLPEDYTMFQHKPGACHNWRIQTAHSTMNVCMADGSVRTVAVNVDPALWKGALKPHDGIMLPE